MFVCIICDTMLVVAQFIIFFLQHLKQFASEDSLFLLLLSSLIKATSWPSCSLFKQAKKMRMFSNQLRGRIVLQKQACLRFNLGKSSICGMTSNLSREQRSVLASVHEFLFSFKFPFDDIMVFRLHFDKILRFWKSTIKNLWSGLKTWIKGALLVNGLLT